MSGTIGMLIATILLAWVLGADAQSLYVPEEISVAVDRVTIGDLVQGSGSDAIRNVAGDFVCRAPNPGESRTIKAEYLKPRLSRVGLEDVSLPPAVRISRASNRVSTERIRAEVIGKIRSLDDAKGKELSIDFMGGLSDVMAPTGPTVVEVELTPHEKLSGRMVVPVTVYVAGSKVATKHVDVQIETLADVWVVKYPVPRGKVLTQDHIESKRIALTKTRGRPYSSLGEILGKRTTRALSEGAVLVGGMVESAPVMKKGDIVSIIIESRELSIRTFGIVEKEAKIGAVVQVTNLDSGKKVYARVIDQSSVQVAF